MRWDDRQRAMLEAMGIRLWPTVAAPSLSPADRGGGEALAERARSTGAQPGAGMSPVAAGVGTAGGGPVALAGAVPVRAAGLLPEPEEVLDGPALAARAAVCTACALCAGRTHAVLVSPEQPADWLVIGDAPDADDDQAGEPFVGAAGQLLDNMLAAIELTRGAAPRERRVHVTHAVKCRPPGQRMPEATEVERCLAYLHREIELVGPRVILAMGRAAAQALLGTGTPAARLRGRVHRHGAAAVVVTASPAHLLRHPESKADAWDDLCLALEAATADKAADADRADKAARV